ncbi:MAG: response regulator transcription factor [Anaerolineae bacterium]|nr:response regulator transcription factor [Anaerolineae bacterium]
MNPLKDKLILVVDDEPRIVRLVRMNLEAEGARVIDASNGLEALKQVREELPNAVILDVMMPELDGFETLKTIRETSDVPVIMLTVRADEDERVRGLELGADDYLGKPFSPRELVSRLKAVLRRTEREGMQEDILKIDDDLSIDFRNFQVIVKGNPVRLRPTEWRLLYHLVRHAGWVLTHDDILAKVWGPEYKGADEYVRLYITYLRQKIEPDPANPKYILTERGIGYKFVDYRKK